jgi:hypothetical protein
MTTDQFFRETRERAGSRHSTGKPKSFLARPAGKQEASLGNQKRGLVPSRRQITSSQQIRGSSLDHRTNRAPSAAQSGKTRMAVACGSAWTNASAASRDVQIETVQKRLERTSAATPYFSTPWLVTSCLWTLPLSRRNGRKCLHRLKGR